MNQQSISSDLIRGHIDTIILHTLLDGDKFAEQISDTIEKKSENAYKINQATLYSALKRLQNIKLLNSYQRDIENGGRRKFFTLTEKGKATVEENLSSWSYSRAIIDKLIDCEQQPIYKTEYIEKIVQVPVEKVVYKEVAGEDKKQDISPIEIQPLKNDNNDSFQNQTQQVKPQETIQEINFRNIINGLIKSCCVKSEKSDNEEPVEINIISQANSSEKEDVQKFNDTITENARPIRRQELETIDFSDLVVKAQEDGYKLRVSNKNSSLNTGNLLINKVNLFTSLAMFLLILAELLVFSIKFGTLINLTTTYVVGLIGIFAIYPIICLIKYLINQFLTTTKNISKDLILTSAIIVFNLLLINFAGVLLFGLDFTIKKDVLLFLIIPAVFYIDIFLYSIVKYCVSCLKICNLNKR